MSKIRKYLFLFLLLILPVNLGKHLDYNFSYISGITVDYLVPTIYLQDIVATLLVAVWLLDFKKEYFEVLNKKTVSFAILFTAGIFLSFLSSDFPLTSASYFYRFFIYTGVFIYTVVMFNKDFVLKDVLLLIGITIIYTSLIGVAQFIKQGSVFNNYLVLGEQPYSSINKAILKERFFNTGFIPPYSIFRHPNTFAGYISLCLAFFMHYWKKEKSVFYKVVVGLGLICLILSFSLIAQTAFLMGGLIYFLVVKYKVSQKVVYAAALFFLTLSLSLPLLARIPLLKQEPSIYRRAELLTNALKNTLPYLPFGKGIGTSTSLFETSVFLTRDFSFFQPVHNIFALILLEAGVFSVIFLVFMLFYLLKESPKISTYAPVLLIQLIILGSFDHYLITMHQTLLLMFLLMGLCLSNRDLLAKK